ncbi:MAG TPA: fibrobacter succinogenes major paralogous domain-containing protein [Bacteroidales bacterium]|nr:fibrobacter succinogenes major paralogous domain-containing protein [Bacteroidales bacterium]
MKILTKCFAIAVALVPFSLDISAREPTEVRIGKYLWMTSNLDVSTFSNGDTILQVKTAEQWVKAVEEGKPAWCYRFDNNEDWTDLWLEDKYRGYGLLYNWHAVHDKRGLLPQGYRTEVFQWEDLVTFLGGTEEAGKKLRNETRWNLNPGTNESGFNALPAGMVTGDGSAISSGYSGVWWTNPTYESIFTIRAKADLKNDSCVLGTSNKISLGKYGFAVRCVREDEYINISWGAMKHYLLKVIPDNRNEIWTSDQNGNITMYDFGSKKLSTFWGDVLKTNVIHDIDIDDNDIVWAGTSKGLASFDGKTWTRYKKTEKQEIYYVAAGTGGIVHYSTEDGFYTFDGRESRKITSEYDSGVARRPIATDKDGTPWILGDSERLYYYNGQQMLYTTGPQESLEYPKISVDKNDNLWITSHTSSAKFGLHKYTGRGRADASAWHHYLEGENVTSVFVDHLDNVWVSTGTGIYKNFKKRTDICKDGIIFQDRNLSIWHIDAWSGEMKLLEVYGKK